MSEPPCGATTQQDTVCPAVTREELKNKKAFPQRTSSGQGPATTGIPVPSNSNVSRTSRTGPDVQPAAVCYSTQMSAAGQDVCETSVRQQLRRLATAHTDNIRSRQLWSLYTPAPQNLVTYVNDSSRCQREAASEPGGGHTQTTLCLAQQRVGKGRSGL